MVDTVTARRPGPVSAKQAQIITPPITVLDVRFEVFVLMFAAIVFLFCFVFLEVLSWQPFQASHTCSVFF